MPCEQHPNSLILIFSKRLKSSFPTDRSKAVFRFQVFCLGLFDLTILLLNTTCPALANSVAPGQLAPEEANWSGSALFVIKYVNFYQKSGSSNLIGWKLEVGVAS